MGLINTALQIGRSAITSYQSALAVVGNNLANSADSDYTRQRAVMDPVVGSPLPEGVQPGGGVALTVLQRVINEALEERLRVAIADTQSVDTEGRMLSQIEAAFNELTDQDLSTRLTEMFNAFQDVQNSPTDRALRGVAVATVQALAQALRGHRSDLEGMVGGINDEVTVATERANALAGRIAELNTEVVAAEAGGHTAGVLRDQRDALLRELSQLVEVTVRYQESGTATVFVGNEALVQLGHSRGLVAVADTDGSLVRVQVRFADDNGIVALEGGRLAGLAVARDRHVTAAIEQLDQLADGLIRQLNDVHTNGQGLIGYSELVGSFAVGDPDAPLHDAEAGLAVTPRTGSFFIAVTDTASGVTTARRIDVDLDGAGGDDTTLNGLVAAINASVPNVSAAVSGDNRLVLTAEPGFTFTFGHDGSAGRDDTSDLLAALGVNVLLDGHSAADIAVNAQVAAQPELLAAAAVHLPGDGAGAAALTDARSSEVASLGGVDLLAFYNQIVAGIGVQAADAQTRFLGHEGSRSALEVERASISGVNLDEEAVDLLRYERAFQGAARYTSVVDQLIGEMLNILR